MSARCVFCRKTTEEWRSTRLGHKVCAACTAAMDAAPKPSARERLEEAFDQDLDSELWMGPSLAEYIDAYRAEVLREAADAIATATCNPLDSNAKLLRRMADQTGETR